MAELSIAICDDNLKFCTHLEEFLKTASPPSTECKIEFFHTGEQLCAAYEEDGKSFDVILLDIEMPHVNGLEAASRIRSFDTEVAIIFLTNYERYAIDGYEAKPYGYLLKTNYEGKLQNMLAEIAEEIKDPWKNYLNLWVSGKFLHIPYGKIIFAESQDQKVLIHTRTETYSVYRKLSEIKEVLDHRFAQSHKSFIINLDYLESVDPALNLIKLQQVEMVVPISRRYRKAFINILTDYAARYRML